MARIRRGSLLLAVALLALLVFFVGCPTNVDIFPEAGVVLNSTLDKTYDSISGAIEEASPGDTILVGAGDYNESITIDKSLTLESRNNAAVLKQQLTIAASDVVVDGFEIVSDGFGILIDYVTTSFANITIKNNIIDSAKHGIVRFQNSDTEFREERDLLTNLSILNNVIGGGDEEEPNQGILLFTALRGETVISNNTFTKAYAGLNAGKSQENFYAQGTITITGNTAPEGAEGKTYGYFAIWVEDSDNDDIDTTGNNVEVTVGDNTPD